MDYLCTIRVYPGAAFRSAAHGAFSITRPRMPRDFSVGISRIYCATSITRDAAPRRCKICGSRTEKLHRYGNDVWTTCISCGMRHKGHRGGKGRIVGVFTPNTLTIDVDLASAGARQAIDAYRLLGIAEISYVYGDSRIASITIRAGDAAAGDVLGTLLESGARTRRACMLYDPDATGGAALMRLSPGAVYRGNTFCLLRPLPQADSEALAAHISSGCGCLIQQPKKGD